MNSKKISKVRIIYCQIQAVIKYVVREFLDEIDLLSEETSEQGTPSYRLNKLGEWAVEHVGHSPISSRGFELTIIEEVERLQAEVSKLKRLEGTDDHIEHRCDKCGGRNITSWYADADVWNRLAGEYSVLCPICLSELAEEEVGHYQTWRVSISDDDPELTKLRVRLHEKSDELMHLHQELEQLRKE